MTSAAGIDAAPGSPGQRMRSSSAGASSYQMESPGRADSRADERAARLDGMKPCRKTAATTAAGRRQAAISRQAGSTMPSLRAISPCGTWNSRPTASYFRQTTVQG